MWQLIKHSISMRRTASVATVVTVALTAAVLFAFMLTYGGVQDGLELSEKRLGADLLVVPAATAQEIDETALLFTGSPAPVYMDAGIVGKCAQVEGVEAVSAQFYGQTLDSSCCSASEPARLVGYDSATDWTIAPWAGSTGSAAPLTQTQVVVGSGVDGVTDGEMSILGRRFSVVARLDATGADLDGSVLMDIDAVRALTSQNGNFQKYWDMYGDPQGLVSAVQVRVEQGADAADVAKALSGIEGVAVVQPSKVMATSAAQLGAVFNIMLATAALMALAALVQVFARFFGLAWDRRSELALYRALGASRTRISKLIGGEALVLVGGGALAGVVLGAGLFMAVPSMLAGVGSFPFVAPGALSWALCAVAVLAAFVLVGAVAVAVPVARINRIDPSAVMQAGDIE